jgi:acyl carrier protein
MVNAKDQIIEVLQELVVGLADRELTDETLLSDLGIDSIKYVELLVQIEEKCDIVFDESDLGVDSLKSMGDLTALLEKTLAQQVN